jgi:hypothetical protein
MPKATLKTSLLPGSVRLVVQLYDGNRRTYSQPAGHSLAGVRVANTRELRRLWNGIQDLVDGATWRDAGAKDIASRRGEAAAGEAIDPSVV